LRKELLLQVEEKREGDAPALFAGRNDEVCEGGMALDVCICRGGGGRRARRGVGDVVNEEAIMSIG